MKSKKEPRGCFTCECGPHETEENLKSRIAELEEALAQYGQHDISCILSRWSAGEPTPNGGYCMKFGDKWYETKPVDKTPKCQCGLDDILTKKEPRG